MQSEALERPHTLPVPASQFVGREDLLSALAQSMSAGERLVTLTGTGGAGKTRLAVEFGHRWLPRCPGGVWFCDLMDVASRDQLLQAIANSLGLLPQAADPQHLGRVIAERGEALFILDNFEQIPQLAASHLNAWRGAARAARFLVTSRRPLMLEGEVVLPVEPLPLPRQGLSLPDLARVPSVALFVSRATAVRPDFSLNAENAEAVGELVRAMEGLPLAIELAAARARVLSPAGMLQRLGDRFALLAGGRRGASQRRTSLWGAIEASWRLLAPWEQAALAQLSVFRGGWTAQAAEDVLDLSAWAEAPQALDTVQGLVDHGLVQSRRAPSGSRFGMYSHIAEFGAHQLDQAASPEALGHADGPSIRAQTELRHARCFGRLSEAMLREAREAWSLPHVLARMLDESENFMVASLAARAQGDGDTTGSLACALLQVANRKEAREHAIDLGLAALSLPGMRPETRYDLLVRLSEGLRRSARLQDALTLADEALELTATLGISPHQALRHRAHALNEIGRRSEAKANLEDAVRLARAAGDPIGEAHALGGLAGEAFREGRLEEAEALAMSALNGFRRLRDAQSEGMMLSNLADLAQARGNWTEAERRYQAALIVARTADLHGLEGHILANLCALAVERGQLGEAEAIAARALERLHISGDLRMEAYCLVNLAEARLQLGRYVEAETTVARVLELAIGEIPLRANALAVHAEASAAVNPNHDVEPALREAEALFGELGDRTAAASVCLRRARIAQLRGDAQGLQAALAAFDAEFPNLPPQRASLLVPLREALSPLDLG